MFVPPAEGHDFREAHVFDFSPKFWHDLTPQARRDLLSPVATPGDTVIDCKGSIGWLLGLHIVALFYFGTFSSSLTSVGIVRRRMYGMYTAYIFTEYWLVMAISGETCLP